MDFLKIVGKIILCAVILIAVFYLVVLITAWI